MRLTSALLPLIAIALSVAKAQTEQTNHDIAQQFILNQERAFAYLQFDHIGKGVRFHKGEPAYRIWFRLVNNCRVPIVIRTFGVPEGSLLGETGLLHKVIAEPPTHRTIIFGSGDPKPTESPVDAALMPDGYDADVSSAATLGPSESLLFSIPFDHLSAKWHIEIPFRFDLPHKRPSHHEAQIGGQPHMTISYELSDLPIDARKQVEAGIR